MVSKLKEEDFEVLRIPLESGRQGPSQLATALILGAIFMPMIYALEYYVAAYDSIFPYKQKILEVHFWLTSVLVLLSIVYAIPFIYRRSQRVQYLLTILVSQNLFTFPLFICALFFIGKEGEGMKATPESLLNFTYILLFIGLLVFLLTFVRFYTLLRKGQYRKGSSKELLRIKFEKKSLLPTAIIVGIGLVLVLQYIIRNSAINDFNMYGVILIGITLFYVMLFILPEQLVILYCKMRFKSFNFNESGYLNSLESE